MNNPALQQEIGRLNSFQVPSVPEAAKRNKNPLYIFNVGPDRFVQSIGSMGEFIIPACPEGKDVSEALVLPEVMPEFYDQGTDRKGLQLWDAMQIARDLVGVGGSLDTHTANHEYHGVFITENETPTKKEIEAAKAKRREWLQYLVNEADGFELQGEGGKRNINVPHRMAARELKVKRTWIQPTVPQGNCPACGGEVPGGVAVCRHCNAVIDEDKARKYFPERFAVKTEAAPAPKQRG